MLALKDNPETTSLYYTKCQSRKSKIIQSKIYRIPLIVNQVIYTLDTIGEPNIMTLAIAVLQIFCSQGPLQVKCLSLKRGIIQSNFDRILWKVNQIIYIMYPNCMPDIMIPAARFSRYFVHKVAFPLKTTKSEKGDNSVKYLQNFATSLSGHLHLGHILYAKSNIMTLAQAVLQIFCSQGPLRVKCLSLKRGLIQSNFDRILWKFNQVIYIM